MKEFSGRPHPPEAPEDCPSESKRARAGSGRLNSRKLLRATLGLAAVSYLGTSACGSQSSEPSSPEDAQETSGSGGETGAGYYYGSGNLMPPVVDNQCDEDALAGGAAGVGGDGGDGGLLCNQIVR